ncbi:tripartite tricarboxylate transporter TctB family protein [Ancylobacter sp. TS-1]|uniref:tripartite tricarboxylate transporter TctB family protein n=1 Tax=Ancylobacter sp. TS-1 TaxID=1850374 RepID=UPI001265C642|nr:tripartite tricarboxylate transporter TctB family protein [Ancylobacter sp. TS-1]QFR33799.1 hypothetical protein GBB76_12115 [Ancylobacter sp. TS-1]
MNIKLLDNIVSVALLLAGGGILFAAIGYEYMPDSVPGPGFFPFWVGLLLVGCVICDLVGRFRRRELVTDRIGGAEIARVGAIVAVFGAMCLAAEHVGLVIPTAAMMVLAGFIMAERPITPRFIGKLLAVTAATIAVGYYVFAHLLGVPLA